MIPLSVTANAETLMRQAGMTAEVYLADAIRSIDALCGDGYARQHPDLIAAYMHVAANDYQVAMYVKTAETIANALCYALHDMTVTAAEDA